MDNVVRTLSYRKLPEENTEMVKPAENEPSKEPQSWAEAAKAAGVLVLSSQEQFDEVLVETAPKKSATRNPIITAVDRRSSLFRRPRTQNKRS